MKDRMAEFKYNEYSGLLARRIAKLKNEGKIEEAQEAREDLRKLWEECINLSKDKDLMWASCLNKHPLLVETPLEEKIAMLQQAIEASLILPESKRKILLLTLAYDSLSHAQMDNSQESDQKISRGSPQKCPKMFGCRLSARPIGRDSGMGEQFPGRVSVAVEVTPVILHSLFDV